MEVNNKKSGDDKTPSLNLRGGTPSTPKLRAMGSQISESMPPGEYRIRCMSGETKLRGGKHVITLKHRVSEGAWNDGVLLSQWLNLKDATGYVSPQTKYGQQCAVALGRESYRTKI